MPAMNHQRRSHVRPNTENPAILIVVFVPFRTINNIANFLDQRRNCARFCSDLFSNTLVDHRARLCLYVEKLMFIAPLEYGRKCEDILWKKCFRDVYTTLKRLKKVIFAVNMNNRVVTPLIFYVFFYSKIHGLPTKRIY